MADSLNQQGKRKQLLRPAKPKTAEITKCQVIFVVFFKSKKNAGGEDFNQFLKDIPPF